MKRLFVLFIVLSNSFILLSQDTIFDYSSIIVNYRYISSENVLSPEDKTEAFMSLLPGKTWTLFYNRHNDEVLKKVKDNPGELLIKTTDASGKNIISINPGFPTFKGITEYIYIAKGSKLCSYVRNIVFQGMFSYEETYVHPAWSLSAEKKQIMGYACQKATTHYKGREWIVWFALEIPIDSGPWKLSGLPGLILSATDSEDQFFF